MTEAQRRKPFRRAIILALIMSSIAACTAVMLIVRHRTRCTPQVQETIEGRIHIDFPPSARKIECGYVFWQGSEAWARLEMSPSDLDAFLKTTSVSSVSKQPIPDAAHFHYNTWFVYDYLYGDNAGEWNDTIMRQFILIDIHNPDVFVVYFEAWF